MGTMAVRRICFKPEEILAGLLYYIQMSYPVMEFPPADHPAWEQLVFHIAEEENLKEFLSWNFNISSALRKVTQADPETKWIRVDTSRDTRGKFLGKCFPTAAHRMYEIALETRGLIQFSR